MGVVTGVGCMIGHMLRGFTMKIGTVIVRIGEFLNRYRGGGSPKCASSEILSASHKGELWHCNRPHFAKICGEADQPSCIVQKAQGPLGRAIPEVIAKTLFRGNHRYRPEVLSNEPIP